VILNLILALVSLSSLLSLVLVTLNPKVVQASENAARQQRLYGVKLGCFWTLLSLTSLGLWTWHSVEQQDWRYAAIMWVPFTVGWIGHWARKVQRKAEVTQ
jgi:hypothetical protein